jgi:CubicO group peptidase (beta-lactamase class C family)
VCQFGAATVGAKRLRISRVHYMLPDHDCIDRTGEPGMRKLIMCLLLLLPLCSSILGQGPNPRNPARSARPAAKEEPRQPADQKAAGPAELTSADLDAFLDGVVPLQLKQNDIAGATVAVVKDGQLLFAKGYGYADVEKKKPVAADETLFRCGSISKLFTWTAVMQLFEQGKLDLNRDVNEYIDFKIPDAFGKPITTKNLMTHTPGFEEQIKDLFGLDAASPDLGKYLADHIPARVFPPGTTPAYSNYGAALAGYIVQRVSGVPFDQYIQENIFKPLDMAHSSFDQPLPAEVAPYMSSGYQLASEAAKPFEMVSPFPAGSLSSAAADISRFMIAHLQDGQYGGARILRAETARLMHSRLFGLDDATNGMAYGFYEESRNGHRIIGHGGDTVYFHSDLHLLLDSNLGFFVSYNSAGKGGSPRTALWEALLDRYFQYSPAEQTSLDSAKEDSRKVTGEYIFSRRSEASFLKLTYLLQETTVSAQDDGAIEVDAFTGLNGKPKKWREVAPMVFHEIDGQDNLVFKPGQGSAMQLVVPFPIFVGERAGTWENQNLLLIAAVFALLVMMVTELLWPIAALVRRHYGRKLEITRGERRLRLAVRLVCALDILFLISYTVLVFYGFTHIWILNDHLDKWIHLIQIIGLIGAAGALILVYNAIHSWIGGQKGFWKKVHATLLAMASLAILWMAIVGHLLNFSTTY